jgi:predicted Zn-dependent protease
MAEALYFDGRSARGQRVRLSVSDGQLHATLLDSDGGVEGQADLLAGQPTTWHWPLADLTWPERTRHTRRVIELRRGGTLQALDDAAFDAWRAQRLGQSDSLVVRVQRHWQAVLAAALLVVVLIVAGYRWGVPLVADAVVALVPADVERGLGDRALAQFDGDWLAPSQTPPVEQQALRDQFTRMLTDEQPDASLQAPWQLHFRHGGDRLGANALALPGGHIVITDEMLALLAGHPDTVLGVLAHEYGHVQQRHGMQALARLTLVSLGASALVGDFSTVLAAMPVLLASAGYSRDAEREADATAARLLKASGRSPAAMVVLFERLRAGEDGRRGRSLPIALASHPGDDERVQFFRDAAR